ncbi:MAG: hypothetical protein LBK40_02560, partial [Spirochaetaceae bacterium]|nr:hypothetical protein [Spirochaetaceae bacterium]
VTFWLERTGAIAGMGDETFDLWLSEELDNSLNTIRNQYEEQHSLKGNFNLSYLYLNKKTGSFEEYTELLRLESAWTPEYLSAWREELFSGTGDPSITWAVRNAQISALNTWINNFNTMQASARSELAALQNQHGLWFLITLALQKDSADKGPALEEAEKFLGPGLMKDQAQALVETKRWRDLYLEYRDRATEARNALIQDFHLVMGEGSLADILGEGTSSEDFFLDEYQIELIRARAVAGYWEQRLETARAVAAYAADLSAGRITESEGLAAWEYAKAAYDEALATYVDIQEYYAAASDDVASAGTALEAASLRLKQTDAALDEKSRLYALELSAYIIGSDDFIYNGLTDEYKRLSVLCYSENKFSYTSYLVRARELGLAQGIASQAELLKELVSGRTEEGMDVYLTVLRFLASDEAGAWYKGETGRDLNNPLGLGSQLKEDYEYQSRALLLERAGLEKEIIEYRFSGGVNIREGAEPFAAGLGFDSPVAEEILASLDRISTALASPYSAETLLVLAAEDSLAGFFLSGGSFCGLDPDSLKGLVPSAVEAAEKSGMLLYVYRNYGGASLAETREAGELALAGFGGVLSDWGFETAPGILPEAKELAGRFEQYNDSGSAENAAAFFRDLDNAAAILPSWAAEVYGSWKASFIRYFVHHEIQEGRDFTGNPFQALEEKEAEFSALLLMYEGLESTGYFRNLEENFLEERIAACSLELDVLRFAAELNDVFEASADKVSGHWRLYISDADRRAYSVNEGLLLDALELTEREREKWALVQDMLSGTGEIKETKDFQDAVRSYLDNPDAVWNEAFEFPLASAYLNDLSDEAEKISAYESMVTYYRAEILRLGRAYDAASLMSAPAGEELARLGAEIEQFRDEYEDAVALYAEAADAFFEAGTAYDLLYRSVKESYAGTEAARQAYEKQDAIQRWAGTSYLAGDAETGVLLAHYKGPEEELAYAGERYARSLIALEALGNLYSNDENRRPYADQTYEDLYRQFREKYEGMMFVYQAHRILAEEIEAEQRQNVLYYGAYQNALSAMTGSLDYTGYTLPETADEYGIKNFLTLKDGKLAFALTGDYSLSVTDEEGAKDLADYLVPSYASGDETHSISGFEIAVRSFLEEAQKFGLLDLNGQVNNEKFRQWGLARDYYILKIISANSGSPMDTFLSGLYEDTSELGSGTNLGENYVGGTFFYNDTEVHEKASQYRKRLPAMQEDAWNAMGEDEQRLMEFYTILTLLGGGGGEDSAYFGRVSEYFVYESVYSGFSSWYRSIKRNAGRFLIGVIYKNAKKELDYTNSHFGEAYRNLAEKQSGAKNALGSGLTELARSLEVYQASSDKIASLLGNKNNPITWEHIETAMGFSEMQELDRLRDCWNDMTGAEENEYFSVEDAFTAMERWSRNAKDDARRDLERQYTSAEAGRKDAEAAYRTVLARFIEGGADIEELNAAAYNAYGGEAAALKNHYENIEDVLASVLEGMSNAPSGMENEYARCAGELTALIKEVYESRYRAEFAAREAEWEIQARDIEEKYNAWLEAAGLILERGRLDWKQGTARFEAKYRNWQQDFANEYKEVNLAWAGAYASGLEDKQNWVDQAGKAAAERSESAMLSLIGADAEMFSRKLDTRDPAFGRYTGVEAAQNALSEVLDSAGITGLDTAFAVLGNSAGTIASAVQWGTGGLGMWNSGRIQTAASALARENYSRLAAAQAKTLAVKARDSAVFALAGLEAQVREANTKFDKSMDESFIMDGQWRRNGQNYIKDIIVHSTLLNSVITDRASVAVYKNYALGQVKLDTDINEYALEEMDPLGIEVLIDRIFAELKDVSGGIFGDGSTDNGLFGEHIGTNPLVRAGANAGGGKDSIFENQGTGELGRLMSDYIYWSMKETVGLSAMHAPLWEKPLWDSRGSWFSAPTLRSVVNIGVSVIAAALVPVTDGFSAVALSIGLNLVDDLVFSGLDVAGGYKSWTEAGFEFGKTALVSTLSTAVTVGFNGFGIDGKFQGLAGTASAAPGTVSSAISSSMLKATQAWTGGLAVSALNAFSYSDADGFGWSGERFGTGITGSLINAAVDGTTVFTTGTLNSGLSGFYGQLHTDGEKLSALLGGSAGQAAGFALGNDFTFNVFNSDILGITGRNGKAVESGLLELHLGRNGVTMNAGTGGVNAGIGTLTAALRGLEAWQVNARLWTSGQDEAARYASALRTLYSGNSVTKAEFEAVLAGRTNMVENRGVRETESVYNEYTGIKTVFLGSSALEDGSRFGLNVVVAHEAYRNGIDDGEAGQMFETTRAVMGHIDTA